MANETTYSRIRHLLPEIWEATLYYMRYGFVMQNAVRVFSDQRGWQNRNVSEYVEGAVQTNLDELEDLTPTLLERELLNQLRVKENGKQILLTDRRIATDDADVVADAGSALGYELGKQVEIDLLGQFANLTGGIVDKSNSPLTWLDIYGARARLAAAAVPAPYNLVLHEWQWLDLATAANIAAVGTTATSQPQLRVRDDIQSRYYMASLGDIDIYVTGLATINGDGDVIGAMFNRNAIALDWRRGLFIEPFRDPSLRATELNGTMWYANGVWRPKFGVQIKSDATAYGSTVSQTSTLTVTGTADDLSATSGQDVTFTFTITNSGSVVATDILVTFTVDSDFTYVSDSPNMGSYNSTTKVWTGFELAPGQTAVMTMVYDIAGAGAMVCTVTSATPTPSPATPAATVTLTYS